MDGSLSLEGSAFAEQSDDLESVNLQGAKVGSQLTMVGATVSGTLNMESLEVGQHLFMRAWMAKPLSPIRVASLIPGCFTPISPRAGRTD